MIEGTLPLREGLEAIHHTAIEAICRRSDEEEHNPRIEDDEPETVKSELNWWNLTKRGGDGDTSCYCAKSCSGRENGYSS